MWTCIHVRNGIPKMFMPPKYYRLLSPLNKLDPTDPRKVENFLIKLRALADCKAAFLPPITRADFRLHFNLVGERASADVAVLRLVRLDDFGSESRHVGDHERVTERGEEPATEAMARKIEVLRWYHVRLHTMGRDDKFDEHALPGFYVGPSPENPEEKYVWTGSRHISVG